MTTHNKLGLVNEYIRKVPLQRQPKIGPQMQSCALPTLAKLKIAHFVTLQKQTFLLRKAMLQASAQIVWQMLVLHIVREMQNDT